MVNGFIEGNPTQNPCTDDNGNVLVPLSFTDALAPFNFSTALNNQIYGLTDCGQKTPSYEELGQVLVDPLHKDRFSLDQPSGQFDAGRSYAPLGNGSPPAVSGGITPWWITPYDPKSGQFDTGRSYAPLGNGSPPAVSGGITPWWINPYDPNSAFTIQPPSEEDKATLGKANALIDPLNQAEQGIPGEVAGISLAELKDLVAQSKEEYVRNVNSLNWLFDWLELLAIELLAKLAENAPWLIALILELQDVIKRWQDSNVMFARTIRVPGDNATDADWQDLANQLNKRNPDEPLTGEQVRRRLHGLKQGTKGFRGDDNLGIDPERGNVYTPRGGDLGNIYDEREK